MKNTFRLLFLTFVLCGLVVSSAEAGKIAPPSILTDSFDKYELGILLGQNGWANYANGDAFMVESLSQKNKAVHVDSQSDNVITKTGVSLADGRQAVMVKTDNRASWGNVPDGNVQVRISDASWGAGTRRFVAVTFKADGNVAYYDKHADVYQNFGTYIDKQWTPLEIEWRSSDKTARYRVNNGVLTKAVWTDWMSFPQSDTFTSFNNVGFGFVQPSGGAGGVYFDNLK